MTALQVRQQRGCTRSLAQYICNLTGAFGATTVVGAVGALGVAGDVRANGGIGAVFGASVHCEANVHGPSMSTGDFAK